MTEMEPMEDRSLWDIRFEKAEESFRNGDLAGALELFAQIARNDGLFFRAYPFLSEIGGKLMGRYRPGTTEADNVREFMRWVEATRIRLEGEMSEDWPGPEPTEKYSSRADEDVRKSQPSVTRRRRRRGRSDPSISATPSRRDEGSVDAQIFVERVPHIDVLHGGPARPGDVFEASVYLDEKSWRAGETGNRFRASAGSEVHVDVRTSSHFRLRGESKARFTVSTESRFEVGKFEIECTAPEEWLGSRPSIVAIFFVDSRPCGSVRREVDVEGVPTDASEPVEALLEIGINGLPPADLTVNIVDEERDGRNFVCYVSTPHLRAYRNRVEGKWKLKDVTSKVVQQYMAEFTADDTISSKLVAALRGAGEQLFEASPSNFQDVFWKLVENRSPLRTIAIVTQEPYIPWELMIPSRYDDEEANTRNPLGVDYEVGRWTDPRFIAAARQIRLKDSHVIAPVYEGEMVLEASEEEAEMVCKQYDGRTISPASFEPLEAALGTVGKSLVHFVCHGGDSDAGVQTIFLDKEEPLSSTVLRGMVGVKKIFRDKRPVVFLNACEVGRGAPALVGAGGFASAFIEIGAAAVIAPLWSVDDKIAHEIASEFYRALKERPGVPFSRIFAEIRSKAYDRAEGMDTYAAYCFYGDPRATAG